MLGVLLRAVYNHIIDIIQLLLSWGQYPRFRDLGSGELGLRDSGQGIAVLCEVKMRGAKGPPLGFRVETSREAKPKPYS